VTAELRDEGERVKRKRVARVMRKFDIVGLHLRKKVRTTIPEPAGYTVKNANSGRCVDAADGATGNGTAVQQWTCATGNTNQQWQFQATDGGYYKVVSRNATTAAWDVTGGPTATGDGAKIQLWSYGGGTNEQWKPVQNTDGTYTINPRNNTDECLDVTGRSTADGVRLQQWTCTGSANQRYVLTSQ
jgi:glucosylceramidase